MGDNGDAARRTKAGTARPVRSLICGFSPSVVGRPCQGVYNWPSADGRRGSPSTAAPARVRPLVLGEHPTTPHRPGAARGRAMSNWSRASLPPPIRLGKSPPTLQPPSPGSCSPCAPTLEVRPEVGPGFRPGPIRGRAGKLAPRALQRIRTAQRNPTRRNGLSRGPTHPTPAD